jgi:hypothetical protein
MRSQSHQLAEGEIREQASAIQRVQDQDAIKTSEQNVFSVKRVTEQPGSANGGVFKARKELCTKDAIRPATFDFWPDANCTLRHI